MYTLLNPPSGIIYMLAFLIILKEDLKNTIMGITKPLNHIDLSSSFILKHVVHAQKPESEKNILKIELVRNF